MAALAMQQNEGFDANKVNELSRLGRTTMKARRVCLGVSLWTQPERIGTFRTHAGAVKKRGVPPAFMYAASTLAMPSGESKESTPRAPLLESKGR